MNAGCLKPSLRPFATMLAAASLALCAAAATEVPSNVWMWGNYNSLYNPPEYWYGLGQELSQELADDGQFVFRGRFTVDSKSRDDQHAMVMLWIDGKSYGFDSLHEIDCTESLELFPGRQKGFTADMGDSFEIEVGFMDGNSAADWRPVVSFRRVFDEAPAEADAAVERPELILLVEDAWMEGTTADRRIVLPWSDSEGAYVADVLLDYDVQLSGMTLGGRPFRAAADAAYEPEGINTWAFVPGNVSEDFHSDHMVELSGWYRLKAVPQGDDEIFLYAEAGREDLAAGAYEPMTLVVVREGATRDVLPMTLAGGTVYTAAAVELAAGDRLYMRTVGDGTAADPQGTVYLVEDSFVPGAETSDIERDSETPDASSLAYEAQADGVYDFYFYYVLGDGNGWERRFKAVSRAAAGLDNIFSAHVADKVFDLKAQPRRGVQEQTVKVGEGEKLWFTDALHRVWGAAEEGSLPEQGSMALVAGGKPVNGAAAGSYRLTLVPGETPEVEVSRVDFPDLYAVFGPEEWVALHHDGNGRYSSEGAVCSAKARANSRVDSHGRLRLANNEVWSLACGDPAAPTATYGMKDGSFLSGRHVALVPGEGPMAVADDFFVTNELHVYPLHVDLRCALHPVLDWGMPHDYHGRDYRLVGADGSEKGRFFFHPSTGLYTLTLGEDGGEMWIKGEDENFYAMEGNDALTSLGRAFSLAASAGSGGECFVLQAPEHQAGITETAGHGLTPLYRDLTITFDPANARLWANVAAAPTCTGCGDESSQDLYMVFVAPDAQGTLRYAGHYKMKPTDVEGYYVTGAIGAHGVGDIDVEADGWLSVSHASAAKIDDRDATDITPHDPDNLTTLWDGATDIVLSLNNGVDTELQTYHSIYYFFSESVYPNVDLRTWLPRTPYYGSLLDQANDHNLLHVISTPTTETLAMGTRYWHTFSPVTANIIKGIEGTDPIVNVVYPSGQPSANFVSNPVDGKTVDAAGNYIGYPTLNAIRIIDGGRLYVTFDRSHADRVETHVLRWEDDNLYLVFDQDVEDKSEVVPVTWRMEEIHDADGTLTGYETADFVDFPEFGNGTGLAQFFFSNRVGHPDPENPEEVAEGHEYDLKKIYTHAYSFVGGREPHEQSMLFSNPADPNMSVALPLYTSDSFAFFEESSANRARTNAAEQRFSDDDAALNEADLLSERLFNVVSTDVSDTTYKVIITLEGATLPDGSGVAQGNMVTLVADRSGNPDRADTDAATPDDDDDEASIDLLPQRADIVVTTRPGHINVRGAENVNVYRINGVALARDANATHGFDLRVAPGIYVVVADREACKVVVR